MSPATSRLPWKGLDTSLLATGGVGHPLCWVGGRSDPGLAAAEPGGAHLVGPAALGAELGIHQAPTEPTVAAFAEPLTAHSGAPSPEPRAFPYLACGHPFMCQPAF